MQPHSTFLAALAAAFALTALPALAADTKPVADKTSTKPAVADKAEKTDKKSDKATDAKTADTKSDTKYTKENIEKICSRFKDKTRHDTCAKRHEPRIGQEMSTGEKRYLDRLAHNKDGKKKNKRRGKNKRHKGGRHGHGNADKKIGGN